jgi:hypothetical protein
MAAAQVGKQTLSLSVLVQKVQENELTAEFEGECTLDQDQGRDCWRSHSTIGIKLGKPWGFWACSGDGVRKGVLVLVTRRSHEMKVEEKTNDSPSKVGSVFNFANKLVERKQEFEKSSREIDEVIEQFSSLEKRMVPEILRIKADAAADFNRCLMPFEFKWEVPPNEAPQRYPGVLYDGLRFLYPLD